MNLQENFSLKPYNTFGVEVNAKYFATFENIETLNEILAKYPNMPILILGGGSNILFTKDFEGIILHNCIKGISVENHLENHVIVEVGAGENWADFVQYCIQHGYYGIENLALIPGTVGASVIQNIGAYGIEVKDLVQSVQTNHQIYQNADCKFGYRDSIFKQEKPKKTVILSVTFKLSKTANLKMDYGDIRKNLTEKNIQNPTPKDVFETICQIRTSKLPNPKEVGNAGSFFKNPEIAVSHFNLLKNRFPEMPSYLVENPEKVKVPAGWLIEKAGWKGKKIGNVGVHDKQALVLVNYGEGKGSEILQLANNITQSVQELFGIVLEKEVNIL